MASPLSPEDELYDEDDPKPRSIDQEDRNMHDVEDPDDDPSERIALKRHASTGTLRGQVRISNVCRRVWGMEMNCFWCSMDNGLLFQKNVRVKWQPV